MFRPIFFFDLDGTISDNHLGITNCLIHGLKKYLGTDPKLNPAALNWCIGPPLRENFTKLLATLAPELTGDPLKSGVEDCVRYYRERYSVTGMFENRMYDGMGEVLEDSVRAGRTLLLVTTKPRLYAEKILRHFGIRGLFFQVHGAELDGSFGHKTQLVDYILKSNRYNPSEVVIIGDTSIDAAAAAKHKLHPIGVTWGWGSIESMRSDSA